MNELCGCCQGIDRLTPIAIANRPGLDVLVYRLGTHVSFLETMLARLSASDFPELRGLTIRTADDPSIALLDAWATVADVLTFYQERIANEGYLCTAIERRSILELARLVGYRLRPGVAASVYLAYTLEKDHDVTILPGNRAQSVPGPGELPQSFETAETLEARFLWNVLKPRMSIPQYIVQISREGIDTNTKDGSIYLKGTGTNLKQNDPVLFVFGAAKGGQVFSHVQDVEPNAAENFTFVKFPFILTPFVFLRDLLQITERYLDLQAFDLTSEISPTDQSVISLLGELNSWRQEIVQLLDYIVNKTSWEMVIRFLSVFSSSFLEELPTWCNTYDRYKKIGLTRLATWISGLIIDIKNFLNRVFGVTIESACTATLPTSLATIISPLARPRSLQPANSVRLRRDITQIFTLKGDMVPQLITTLNPAVGSALYTAYANADVTTKPPLQNFYALRVKAAPFGNNAPLQQQKFDEGTKSFEYGEWALVDTDKKYPNVLHLDGPYDHIVPESWVVIEYADGRSPVISKVQSVQALSRADYGISAKVTRLTLYDVWLTDGDLSQNLSLFRGVTVYTQSEEIPLPDQPFTDDISGDLIELDRLYDGLKSGRWIIVSGERTDVLQLDGTPISGIRASELVMLVSVTQGIIHQVQIFKKDSDTVKVDLPGDKIHTSLHLANRLAYTYKRDTVTIYGNVVRATHGETRTETLGSGDGSKALQRFTLRQSPLTYLSAPTAAGAQSTLQVRVNDILWHEADSLAGLGPTDRSYITETDDADKTSVTSGNGQYGARLPTGIENVKAVYRTGIGKPGNVKAEQITLLATKPLGVKSVINPLRASGGADRESRDQARRNVPVALLALDRLVSVQDYADFARTYAGIGKASAVRLSDGRRQLVHLTIVGADNIPIDESSNLFQNLFQSLRQFGDPNEPLTMELAVVMFIVISAKVRLLPDYALEFVEPKIRTALLDFFSFERRELGQPVFQSEVFSVIQGVAGVDYVDLEILGAVDEDKVVNALDKTSQTPPDPSDPKETATEEFLELLGLTGHDDVPVSLAHVDPNAIDPARRIIRAQLAFLTPDLPDTLILRELPK